MSLHFGCMKFMKRILWTAPLLFASSMALANSEQKSEIGRLRVDLDACHMYYLSQDASLAADACVRLKNIHAPLLLDLFPKDPLMTRARALFAQWTVAIDAAGTKSYDAEVAKFISLSNEMKLEL